MPPKISFWRALAIFSGLLMLLPMSFDVYLPAMPTIAEALAVGDGRIQLTLATLNLGLALGQVIYGPLADRYGRRPILLASMAVFALTHLIAIWASDLTGLAGLRFLHGFSGAAASILVRAVVRDLYEGPAYARMLAYTFVTAAFMPIVGPMIGGGLIAFFAWPSIFLFMGAVGVAVFLSIWFGLPETGVRDPEALQIRSMGRTYALLGSSRTFMLYTLAGVGPYLGLFAVLTDIAPVLIGAMGLTPPQFGVLFAVIMIGNLVASVAAGRLVARLGINRLILVGSSTCLVASLVGFMVTNAGYISPMPIVLTASAFMIGFALVMPAVTAGAMSPFPGLAGRASSLMGIIHYGTATLTALMLGLVADGSHRPLMIALLVGGVLALAGYLAILRGIRKSG